MHMTCCFKMKQALVYKSFFVTYPLQLGNINLDIQRLLTWRAANVLSLYSDI